MNCFLLSEVIVFSYAHFAHKHTEHCVSLCITAISFEWMTIKRLPLFSNSFNWTDFAGVVKKLFDVPMPFFSICCLSHSMNGEHRTDRILNCNFCRVFHIFIGVCVFASGDVDYNLYVVYMSIPISDSSTNIDFAWFSSSTLMFSFIVSIHSNAQYTFECSSLL